AGASVIFCSNPAAVTTTSSRSGLAVCAPLTGSASARPTASEMRLWTGLGMPGDLGERVCNGAVAELNTNHYRLQWTAALHHGQPGIIPDDVRDGHGRGLVGYSDRLPIHRDEPRNDHGYPTLRCAHAAAGYAP